MNPLRKSDEPHGYIFLLIEILVLNVLNSFTPAIFNQDLKSEREELFTIKWYLVKLSLFSLK